PGDASSGGKRRYGKIQRRFANDNGQLGFASDADSEAPLGEDVGYAKGDSGGPVIVGGLVVAVASGQDSRIDYATGLWTDEARNLLRVANAMGAEIDFADAPGAVARREAVKSTRLP